MASSAPMCYSCKSELVIQTRKNLLFCILDAGLVKITNVLQFSPSNLPMPIDHEQQMARPKGSGSGITYIYKYHKKFQ